MQSNEEAHCFWESHFLWLSQLQLCLNMLTLIRSNQALILVEVVGLDYMFMGGFTPNMEHVPEFHQLICRWEDLYTSIWGVSSHFSTIFYTMLRILSLHIFKRPTEFAVVQYQKLRRK